MRRTGAVLALAAAAGAVLLVIFWRHGPEGDAGLQHWLAIKTGTCPVEGNCQAGPGPYYGWFSGTGSVLPWSAGIIGVLVTAFVSWLHHVNCHATGCWRKGRYPVAGGAYKICRRCHNQMHERDDKAPVTIGHIREHHDRHAAASAGMAAMGRKGGGDGRLHRRG